MSTFFSCHTTQKIAKKITVLQASCKRAQSNVYYHPRMRVGNVFGRVCLSVCVSVCLSVQTITFEPLHTGTSFLGWRYILTISRSSSSIKVIGSRSRSCAKNGYLQAINKVKVTHQGQHQIEVILRRDTLTRVVCI